MSNFNEKKETNKNYKTIIKLCFNVVLNKKKNN